MRSLGRPRYSKVEENSFFSGGKGQVKMKKALFIGLLLLTLSGYLFLSQQSKSVDTSNIPAFTSPAGSNTASIETDTVEVLLNVLDALDVYNFSTETITNFEDITSLMTDLMNAKKYMREGDQYVQQYTNHSNEYISVTALGMVTGSKAVQESTENLIQYLRGIDEYDPDSYSDLQYQTAKYLSDNKEGFKLIATSAPQITALLWESAQSDNPSGPIPYTVSKEERQRVLKRINELFADDLREYQSSTDSYSSMIFAVDAIKNNIEPDTYEEAG